MRKVHRGHWNEASGSELRDRTSPAGPRVDELSRLPENPEARLGRTGSGVCSAGPPGCLLVALDIIAFRTCVKVGLMPQARHGGRGVWALAVVGSKLEGTGFEKLQMVQTQVAVLAGGGSTGDTRSGPSSCCAGEALLLREGVPGGPGERCCREERLVTFGIKVILGDDLRNPPCELLDGPSCCSPFSSINIRRTHNAPHL